MTRLAAADAGPEVLKQFDGDVHGRVPRRDFRARAGRYAAAGTTSGPLQAQLSPSFAAPLG